MTLADYNQAVDLHADGLYRFALKHLRDRDSAKDIVQESFARLWAKVTEVDAAKAKSLPVHHRPPCHGGRRAQGWAKHSYGRASHQPEVR